MMLSELIQGAPPDVAVSGISDDSRRVRPGDLFCAVAGASHDGRQFAAVAVDNGAVAVLAESPLPDVTVPVVEVPGLGRQLGIIASRFYGEPSAALQVIAVTGTNGKTSFTHLLSQALGAGDISCGIVGTMGYGLPGELREPDLTTPPAVDLQRRLRELLDAGCSAVVLEASSHGLVQGRLTGTQVDIAVLTNITHDHLDYHENFEAYCDAKAGLFRIPSVQTAVLNLGDDYAPRLMREIGAGSRVVTYSLADSDADITATSVAYTRTGLSADVRIGQQQMAITAGLYGEFNLENMLAVIAVLHGLGWAVDDIHRAVTLLTPVAGRMEVVTGAGMPTLIVDYAHTPDALEKCLAATRSHFRDARICVVFGCGGDRDRAKRPMMGAIAARLADKVVLTSDNPRGEDPEQILDQIEAGVGAGEFVRQADRRGAIMQAIVSADADDVVLVAGKGHEDYQELAGGRVSFSDLAVAREALAARADGVAHGKGV